MKSSLLLTLFCLSGLFLHAQSEMEHPGVHKACMNYINGFYNGDTTLLIESIRPELHKHGFWQQEDGDFKTTGFFTYEKALEYARKVNKSGKFTGPDAPKEVKVLHVGHNIAVAYVKASWGIDYLTLSREGDKWMIEQALWEGPLNRK